MHVSIASSIYYHHYKDFIHYICIYILPYIYILHTIDMHIPMHVDGVVGAGWCGKLCF